MSTIVDEIKLVLCDAEQIETATHYDEHLVDVEG